MFAMSNRVSEIRQRFFIPEMFRNCHLARGIGSLPQYARPQMARVLVVVPVSGQAP